MEELPVEPIEEPEKPIYKIPRREFFGEYFREVAGPLAGMIGAMEEGVRTHEEEQDAYLNELNNKVNFILMVLHQHDLLPNIPPPVPSSPRGDV